MHAQKERISTCKCIYILYIYIYLNFIITLLYYKFIWCKIVTNDKTLRECEYTSGKTVFSIQ